MASAGYMPGGFGHASSVLSVNRSGSGKPKTANEPVRIKMPGKDACTDIDQKQIVLKEEGWMRCIFFCLWRFLGMVVL